MTILNFVEFLPPDNAWWPLVGWGPNHAVVEAWRRADAAMQLLTIADELQKYTDGDLDMEGELKFHDNGCLQSDESINCTAACATSTNLLASYYTLWNCVTLARVATWQKFDPAGPLYEEIVSVAQSAGKALGVPDLSSFDGIGVIEKALRCANASCAHDDNACWVPRLEPNTTSLGADIFPGVKYDICVSSRATINADVAGPGVLTTYVVEIALALYILAVSRLFVLEQAVSSIQQWLHSVVHIRPSLDNYCCQFIHSLKKLNRTRFFYTTVQFCAEFQEAQSFLILAACIATIIAFNQPVSFGGGDSWASIQETKRVVVSCVTTGMIAVTITQLALHRLRKSSIYSLLFATLACALVTGILFNQPSYTVDQIYWQFRNQNNLPECGGNPSMMTFCDSSVLSNTDDSLAMVAAVFSLSILTFLWFSRVGALFTITELSIMPLPRKDLCKEALQLCLRASKLMFLLSCWAYEVLCLYIVRGTIQLLTKYMKTLPRASSIEEGFQPITWNMGQVIAVLVWSPVLAKYLYALLFGLERGFELRLPGDFVVKRREPVRSHRRSLTLELDEETMERKSATVEF